MFYYRMCCKVTRLQGGYYERCHIHSMDSSDNLWFPPWRCLPHTRRKKFQEDSIKTSGGDLKITFIGHGTLMLTYAGKVIHADPVSMYADYATLPKADLILVTHEHGDHLDMKAIQAASTANTSVIVNPSSAQECFPTASF